MGESNIKKFAGEQIEFNKRTAEMFALIERTLIATTESLPKDIQAAIKKHQQFAPIYTLNSDTETIKKIIIRQTTLHEVL